MAPSQLAQIECGPNRNEVWTIVLCEGPKVLVRGKVAVVCQHSHVEPGSQAHLEHKRKLLQLLELHDLHDSVQLVWLDIVGEEVDKLDHESSRKHEVQHCLVCKHCINARQTVHKKNYVSNQKNEEQVLLQSS